MWLFWPPDFGTLQVYRAMSSDHLVLVVGLTCRIKGCGYPLLHKDHCLACDRLGPELISLLGISYFGWLTRIHLKLGVTRREHTILKTAHSRNIGGTQFSQEKHLPHSSTLIQMRAVYTIYMLFSSGACNNLMSGFCHPDIQMFDGTEIRLNPRNDFWSPRCFQFWMPRETESWNPLATRYLVWVYRKRKDLILLRTSDRVVACCGRQWWRWESGENFDPCGWR